MKTLKNSFGKMFLIPFLLLIFPFFSNSKEFNSCPDIGSSSFYDSEASAKEACDQSKASHGLSGECGFRQRSPFGQYVFMYDEIMDQPFEGCGTGAPQSIGFRFNYAIPTSFTPCPTNLLADPNTGKCVEPEPTREDGKSACEDGNPISIANGNKFQREIDYQSNGLFPLEVIRSYNATMGKWRFLPELRFSVSGNTVTVVRADGKGIIYTYDSNTASWVGPPDIIATLTTVTDANQMIVEWRYESYDITEVYDQAAKIKSISNRYGLSHTYSYSTNETITVTHSDGRVLTYLLDDLNRIVGFIDSDDLEYQYEFDTQTGNITSIIFPDGNKKTYGYLSNNSAFLLNRIDDENSVSSYARWLYDSSGRAIRSEHFNGAEQVDFDYSNVDDPVDPRVTTTNALGKQTTYRFVTINGEQKISQVEGLQSANCLAANKNYTYYPNGLLQTKTDWQGNTTSYQYNARNLESSRTEAVGTPQERTITTEWHPTFNLRTKITEPGRETLFTYDAQGRLLSQASSDLPLQ